MMGKALSPSENTRPLKVEVREASPAGQGTLMSFIRGIRGGNDYIPYVWEDWLRHKNSKVLVILADGRQVGMNRVRFIVDRSTWLEGARVRPDFRGMDLASALAEETMRIARKKGARLFRLTCSSRNKQPHRQIARIGLQESSRLSVRVPCKTTKPRANVGVRRAGRGDLAAVTDLITTS